ncbi:MAG: pyridoxal phosphate-dependent aminotransferase [Clostridiales bacterium]|nr:pyridoxal phosphate-dependent aminotransferase [Clostridiales bacterium]
MTDFNKVVNRRGTGSLKWDVAENELPMWVADMDFPTAPCVTEAVLRKAKSGVFGYQIVPDEWYSAIINWWRTRHNLTIERDWLCFTTGVVPAITSSVKRLTNIGDNVVVLTPVYDIFFHSIENTGRHTLECPLAYDGARYSIDFSDLELKLSHENSTLLILCNPHNPVGKVWSKQELAAVGELCLKHGVTVLSDEIHCDLTEPGTHYVPFASVSATCRDISVTAISASKAFSIAGLQSAAVFVANEHLRNIVVRGLNSDEVAEPNAFACEATIAAFNQGGQWLDELREYISQNRKIVGEYLTNNLPQLKLIAQDATYLLWVDCSAVTDDSEALCDFIREQTGLYLNCGTKYRGNGRFFIRLNVACPKKTLLDGLKRLKVGIENYIKSK